MEAVLVTGASGFIGSHLVARLRRDGRRVHVLVRSGSAGARLRALGCTVFLGDVTLPESLRPAVQGCGAVIHCARGGAEARESSEVNVRGTLNLAAAAHDAGVRRLVHLSSVVAHGRRWPAEVTEELPLQFRGDAYGVSKAESERDLRAAARESGLEVVIVRPTIVYGPGSPRILADLDRVRYERIKLLGHGVGLLNLVYVDDLVDGLCLAETAPAAAGEAFLLSGAAPVTVRDYFGALARMSRKPLPPSIGWTRGRVEAFGSRWHFRFTRRPRRVHDQDAELMGHRETVTIAKARRLLGFAPRVSLAEGMGRVEGWLREAGRLPARSAA